MKAIVAAKKMNKIGNVARFLRSNRVYHRYIGIFLFAFLLISSITGILLGWKKELNLLQPTLVEGTNSDLNAWLPLSEIAIAATMAMDSIEGPNSIDRIEVRPVKGMVKVLFGTGYWEVQVDGVSGTVLSVGRRHADWIESLHDGSIISEGFKVVSMNVLGIGLLILSVSGFYLWFGPRKIRKMKSLHYD